MSYRFTELDRAILAYVDKHPGCTKREAGVMGQRMSVDGAIYRNRRVTSLIHRGLIRDEGRAGRASLYLAEEGRHKLDTENELDQRILDYVEANPGCTVNAASRATGTTRPRVESLIDYGLLRHQVIHEEGRPRRVGLFLAPKKRDVEGELIRRILRYVADNPGCSKSAAEHAADPTAVTRSRVNALIYRHGLIRNEGVPERSRLYLTDKGRAVLAEDDS